MIRSICLDPFGYCIYKQEFSCVNIFPFKNLYNFFCWFVKAYIQYLIESACYRFGNTQQPVLIDFVWNQEYNNAVLLYVFFYLFLFSCQVLQKRHIMIIRTHVYKYCFILNGEYAKNS